ncbi:cell division protein [Thioploca ingrica]|uniref:Cell division protein FtsX n=1 Tax=Thioploca ingrica TaxID=40754 RepID=A0A090ADX4_9GAMM|nr:cell division protein [Thioploca ingrica]
MKSTMPPEREPRHTAKPPSPTTAWFTHHLYVWFYSLGQIARTPLPSLMTAAVIGIALALPTGLYLLLENVQDISRDWGGAAQISLFLNKSLTEAQVHKLAEQLLQRPDISTVRIILPAEALEEYRALSGFGEALSALKENPLPPVLVVQPATPQTDFQASEAVLDSLSQLKEVEVAQFDMLWLKRLYAMIQIIRRGIGILATLLSLAVLLVIGNTIRLSIYNRREEIEIYKLVGATDAFIRRPFLYIGFWYGLSGGLIAWLLVNLSFWLLQTPVKKLTALYYNQFELVTLDLFSSTVLLLTGALLGLAGAGLAVGYHLKDIQPR